MHVTTRQPPIYHPLPDPSSIMFLSYYLRIVRPSRTDRSVVFRMHTSSSKVRHFPCVQPLCKISVPCIHNNLASISIRTPPITTWYRSPFQNELILNLKVHGQPFVLQYPKNTPREPHRALTPLSELHGQTLSPNLNCTTSSKPS